MRGYFWRGLSTEGNLRFKIYWASLIVGSKFTVFALFHFVFEGNFPSTSPRGGYIWRGDLTEGFLCNRFWGRIFGGACTWSGLFSEFYGICKKARELRHDNFMGQGESVLCNFAERAQGSRNREGSSRTSLDSTALDTLLLECT